MELIGGHSYGLTGHGRIYKLPPIWAGGLSLHEARHEQSEAEACRLSSFPQQLLLLHNLSSLTSIFASSSPDQPRRKPPLSSKSASFLGFHAQSLNPFCLALSVFAFFLWGALEWVAFCGGEMNNTEREEGEVWYDELLDEVHSVNPATDFNYLVMLAFLHSFSQYDVWFFFLDSSIFGVGSVCMIHCWSHAFGSHFLEQGW